MIVYLTVLFEETVGSYLRTWGRDLAGVVRVVPYHALGQTRRLPRASYIFADVERLRRGQATLVEGVHDAIAAQEPALPILNHPTRSLARVDLLKSLRAQGINTFGVYRATESIEGMRYPVFVRCADDHMGPRTDPIDRPEDVASAVAHAVLHGYEPEEVLLVEFEDTRGADGLFRKYSAFRVGDRIIPRHLVFSERWIQKRPDLMDVAKLAEERAYLDGNPHAAELMDIFNTARIEYGRMDYAVVDGRIVVWEVNTNPILLMPPDSYRPEHLDHQKWFAAKLRVALEELAAAGGGGEAFGYTLTAPIGRAW